MNPLPVISPPPLDIEADDNLKINAPVLTEWLIAFLRDEITRRRGFTKAVVGLSGGVDSSLVAFLLARALGPENVYAIRMPYKSSARKAWTMPNSSPTRPASTWTPSRSRTR